MFLSTFEGSQLVLILTAELFWLKKFGSKKFIAIFKVFFAKEGVATLFCHPSFINIHQ